MRPIALVLVIALSLAGFAPVSAEPAFIRLAIDGQRHHIETSSAAIDAETPFAIASIGKVFTAVAILRLVERGLLDLNAASAGLLLPPFASLIDDLDGISLRHHLTMTSGLPDYYTDDWLEDALTNPDRFQNIEAALGYVSEEPVLFRPGSNFYYTNTDYLILGLVLESVTGKNYAEVLEREIFAPSGMADSFVFGSRSLPTDFALGHENRDGVRLYYSGQGFGDGGVISSAGDLVRFYQALFIKRQLLSGELITTLLSDPLGIGYGMGIEIEGNIVGHSGGDIGYSADVRMDLERGALAITLIASEEANTSWTWEQINSE